MYVNLQIEKEGLNSVNVKDILLEMRKYRMGLIQTPDQLRFSYQAIIEGAKQLSQPPCDDTEVSNYLFNSYVYFRTTPFFFMIAEL